MDKILTNNIFSTERLIVRQYQPGDEENFYSLNGDEDVMRYIREVKSKEDSDSFLKEVIAAYSVSPPTGRWAVEDKKTGEFVGSFGIIPVPGEEDKTQLGYSLLPGHWGKGFATELTKAALDYVDQKLELDEIYGIAETPNISSKNVLVKCGFVFFETRVEEEKELLVFIRKKL